MNTNRINDLAQLLNETAYEDDFGSKKRGRFIVDREDLRKLLKVSILDDSIIKALSYACLENSVAMICLDNIFAFIEVRVFKRFRKIPTRLVNHYSRILAGLVDAEEKIEQDAPNSDDADDTDFD